MPGKVAIVTGGGRGIGRAICRRLADEGTKVVAVARSKQELGETKRLVEQDGGFCAALPADVGQVDQVDAMVASVERDYGGIDVLVNNAGKAHQGAIESFDPGDFDAMAAVNIAGPFYACRAVWPVMRRRGGGIIVNISSVAAVDPFPGFAVYGATKAYLDALTRGLAQEGKEHGIRVYAIAPGAVHTQMLLGPFPDFPLDQCLQPEDIAEMVWLMTQPACRHSAGQVVRVTRS